MTKSRTMMGRASVCAAAAALLLLNAAALAIGPSDATAQQGAGDYGYLWYVEPGKYVTVDAPVFATEGVTELAASERVIGVVLEGRPYCLPIRMMTYHHIVRILGTEKCYAVTYCALADSAVTYSVTGGGLFGPRSTAWYRIYGSYGGTLVFSLRFGGDEPVVGPRDPSGSDISRYGYTTAIRPQLRPGARLPNARSDWDGMAGARIDKPAVITTYGRWMAIHRDALILQPEASHTLGYQLYDRSPRGYQHSAARDKGLKSFDNRMPPGHPVFGVAIDGVAACWTMEELRKRGSDRVTLGDVVVDVKWDGDLDAPVVANANVPKNLIATRCYWYAWANFYPESRTFGIPPAKAEVDGWNWFK